MKRLLLITLFASQLSGCAGLGALAVGSIIYYKSSQHEVATVNIEAKPENVYRVAIDTIEKNPQLEIRSKDAHENVIELMKGSYALSLKVSKLDAEHSQLILASSVSADVDPGLKPMIQGVLKICSELKVECHLSEQ